MATDSDPTAGMASQSNGQNASGAPAQVEPSTAKAPEPEPIPGLELLGRGIYLKPRQPYELKQRLVNNEKGKRTVYCADAYKSYYVPNEYEVNHSPPMPTNQMLNQTVIEHSWESLESHFEVNANIAAGVAAFSVKANHSQIDQLRSSEEAYYALRTSFIPAWTVDYTEQPVVDALHLSLRIEVERVLFIQGKGESRVWEFDLETLLDKPTKDLTDTDLTKIRELAVNLQIPEEAEKPLDLDELRHQFGYYQDLAK